MFYMVIPKKVINFLEKAGIKYQPIKHRTVYTAFDKAQTLKVPQKIIGKTLVMKLDNRPALVLIPANKNLDKKKFLKVANIRMGAFAYPKAKGRGLRYSHADFIKEAWMKKNLKGVKIGAIPPFGDLWPARQRVRSQAKSGGKLPTFIDKSLTGPSEVIVNSGHYNFSLKIKGSLLKNLMIGSVIGNFAKVKK